MPRLLMLTNRCQSGAAPQRRRGALASCAALVALLIHVSPVLAEPPAVAFQASEGSLQITLAGQLIAEYVWNDEQVRRPYFKHLRTPSGQQITRNHPPVKGQDIDDHPTMHPGLWLSFGDLNGADFWRNQGRVRHVEFVAQPAGGAGSGSFTARSAYEHDGETIATEDCRITVSAQPSGYLLAWESTFRPAGDKLTFGDQEEMGLGVRVATPLAVAKGGEIIDSAGRKNGKEVWGQQADWCEYRGTLDGQSIGVVLMPDPRNFRRSWFHARDYGLLVANPFGQRAFTKSEPSQIVVPRGEEFRLRFGVRIYSTTAERPFDAEAAYRAFVATSSARP